MNDFDRIVYTAVRHRSAMPDLYRALIDNDLLALTPRDLQTEMIGGFVLENGAPFPFVQLTEKDGRVVVPIFTSDKRVDECLKRAKVPPKAYSIAEAPGRVMMEVLGAMNLHAVLNKDSKKTGTITLPPNLMRDLASGKVLDPTAIDAVRETVRLRKIDPADFPTDFVQALFEVLRKHRNFRAAWIFNLVTEKVLPEGGKFYAAHVLMEPRDEAIFHEFNMVVQAARNRRDDVRLGLVDEDDWSYVRGLFRQATPFFIAADYEPPAETGAEPPAP